MNFFSRDPEDRDAARVRAELSAMPALPDEVAETTGAERPSRDRNGTIALRPWSRLVRFAHGLRAVWRDQVEAQERLAIINRPWIHDNAHWHELSGGSVVLHGKDVPPNRRSIPVTTGGWCPSPARTTVREYWMRDRHGKGIA